MARTEYYDDPNAPKPNGMVVAASAVVTDDEGRILLQRRRDNDLWALPGGGMDLTDSPPGTAVREVKEETGLHVEVTGLVGTYTDPKHIIEYTDGEVRRQLNVCFTARATGGQPTISDGSTELRFVRPDEIEQLPMRHTQQLRVRHFLVQYLTGGRLFRRLAFLHQAHGQFPGPGLRDEAMPPHHQDLSAVVHHGGHGQVTKAHDVELLVSGW